jgi:hypothetical protein
MASKMPYFSRRWVSATLGFSYDYSYWITPGSDDDLVAFGSLYFKGPSSEMLSRMKQVLPLRETSADRSFNAYVSAIRDILGSKAEWEYAAVSLAILDKKSEAGYVAGRVIVYTVDSDIKRVSPDQSLAGNVLMQGGEIEPRFDEEYRMTVLSGISGEVVLGDQSDGYQGRLAVVFSVFAPDLSDVDLGGSHLSREETLGKLLPTVASVDPYAFLAIWD